MFLKRSSKRKVVLRAVTTIPHLVEHFAPIPLSRMTPDWWKQTPLVPADFDKHRSPPGVPPPSRELAMTVKHCYALRELFSRAIVLRLWADYQVMVEPNGNISAHCPLRQKPGEQHPKSQFPGMIQDWGHYKFMCPWLLISDSPLHFYYTHPFYHYSDPAFFQTMPGVTEFYWQNHAHANCIFPIKKELQDLGFPVGAPIAYLVPMEDVTIEVQAEEVTQAEYERLDSTTRLSFHHHRLSKEHGIRPDKSNFISRAQIMLKHLFRKSTT